MVKHQRDQEQYIVINTKDIENLSEISLFLHFEVETFLEEILMYLPQNDYIVCDCKNPYADKIKQIISAGRQVGQ